jgi:hypothetical protein
MHTNIASVLLASVLMLSIVGLTTTSIITAQPFDITTEQGDQEALITVKLATNNTVVIPPNGTVIEVPGNITQIDNDTVIITPDNDTVTDLPGNVTVITPPEPEPCGCPEPGGNDTGTTEPEGPIDPVIVQPAPGQEVITENGTELVSNETQAPTTEPEPVLNDTTTTIPIEPIPEPAQNETVPVEPAAGGNVTEGDGGGGDNETSSSSSNDTGGILPASLNLGWLKL